MSNDSTSARDYARPALIAFLETIARPGCALEQIGDNDNLIDIGVIDSLAMLHIITHLETVHGVSLSAAGIDPGQLISIGGIISAIENTP